MDSAIKNGMDQLLEAIKVDYRRWHAATGKDATRQEIKNQMIAEFEAGLTYKVGNKYIKVIKEHSVWGFIVNTDKDKKFRKGDILMAAGYNAPARNKRRGNILEGGYTIQWTGPLYL